MPLKDLAGACACLCGAHACMNCVSLKHIRRFKNTCIDISAIRKLLLALSCVLNESNQSKWTPTITLSLFWPILRCWLTFALVSSVWAKASGLSPPAPPPFTASGDISAWLPLSPLPLQWLPGEADGWALFMKLLPPQ